MIANYLRVILDSGTLSDYTLKLQQKADAAPFVLTTTDYLYIGQYLPFNSLFVDMGVVNSNTAIISIDVFNGSTWQPVVDIIDATNCFKQSGVIQWTLNKNVAWQETPDTSAVNMGLSSLHIYDLYWVRLKVSANLSAATTVKRIRYKFTEEVQLQTLEPELANIRAAWENNKTDWLDQILTGSEMVAMDLKNRKIIEKHNQIFRFDELYLPTAYQVLDIIYSALGTEYNDKRDDARKKYKELIGYLLLTVDKNKDGHITKSEIIKRGGEVYR